MASPPLRHAPAWSTLFFFLTLPVTNTDRPTHRLFLCTALSLLTTVFMDVKKNKACRLTVHKDFHCVMAAWVFSVSFAIDMHISCAEYVAFYVSCVLVCTDIL